ncbi:DUF3961 domain-containing protein [Planococcus plakortidis]
MKNLNSFFFGSEVVCREDALWFYGTHFTALSIVAFLMISITN